MKAGFCRFEPWQMLGLFYGTVLMAEPSTGALAVTGALASVGQCAAFPELDPATLVGSSGGAFLYIVFANAIAKCSNIWASFPGNV
ncbi:hypothetical protein IAE33_003591 [Pseudomonas sp. S60]|nr:hypothetical protein [Pseudomonas sp. S60]